MSTFLEQIGIDQGIVIIILLLMVIMLLMFTFNLYMSMNRLNRKYKMFMKGSEGQSLERSFANKFNELDKLIENSQNHSLEIANIKSMMEKTLNKYGIVKYDAFDDVGGKLSFVLAMLDKNNTGFILNTIHSRENCFQYIKEIVNGESYIMLSREEIEALKRAVNFGLILEEEKFEN